MKYILLVLFLTLLNLKCGVISFKFADAAWQTDSLACMHGNMYLSKYTSYAAILGLLVDWSVLGIPYLILFRVFSRVNRIRFGAILGIYMLGCIPISTQYVWLSDRSPACAFDFQIGNTKIKEYSTYGSLAEIAQLGFWTMVPEACVDKHRLANLSDQELILQILAKQKYENGVLIFEGATKRFLSYAAKDNKLVIDDSQQRKSAYCILP